MVPTMRKAILPILAAVLSACAATNAGSSSLTESQWRFVAIDGAPPVSETASLSFQSQRLNANVGCNGMGGPWRVEGGRLIAGPLISTKMFCEGRMEQENAVSAMLSGGPRLALAGDRMTLTSAGHSAELVRTGKAP